MRPQVWLLLASTGILVSGSSAATKYVDEKDDQIDYGHSRNITLRFKDLNFKVLCEDEEWKPAFLNIRADFAECLHVKKILVDEKESEDDMRSRDFALIFGEVWNNGFCRMSRYWNDCYHFLEGMDCLEPNPDALINKGGGYIRNVVTEAVPPNKKLPAYDWRQMHRAYKISCQVAKLSYQASPFGPYGKGLWF